MSDTDNIVSIGDDFRNYDRRFWGWRDRARADREDRQADLTSEWILGGPKNPPPDHVMSWQLHGQTKADEQRQRRQRIARLEEKHGLRERPWF
jgi:hypothetical protein